MSQFVPFVYVDAVLDVIIKFKRCGVSFTEVISSNHHIQYFCWILHRPVVMWCDAALRRTVIKMFSSLWQSVGRECLLRVASTFCLYLSQ